MVWSAGKKYTKMFGQVHTKGFPAKLLHSPQNPTIHKIYIYSDVSPAHSTTPPQKTHRTNCARFRSVRRRSRSHHSRSLSSPVPFRRLDQPGRSLSSGAHWPDFGSIVIVIVIGGSAASLDSIVTDFLSSRSSELESLY